MSTLGDLIGDKANLIAREVIGVGDVHIIPLTLVEGITPKDGEEARNKFVVVLGFDAQGNAIGGVVINSKINYHLPQIITDNMMPITVKQCPFLSHDSFVNCSKLVVFPKDKISSKTYRGKIEDQKLMEHIVGTVVESPTESKQRLKEFGLIH